MDFDPILLREFAYNAGIGLALLLVVYGILYLLDNLATRIKRRLLGLNLQDLKLFGIDVINTGKQQLIITAVVNGLQVLLSVAFIYAVLVLVLSEIPATEHVAGLLVDLIFEPVSALYRGFIGFLPNLFNIIVTILVARYLIRAVKYISRHVVAGDFHFPGFDRRTARTTGSLLNALIYILAVIIILPNMPGYESFAFKGIATFLGALITIGGSSVIANYMAGIVITYMHAFEKGDWVTLGEVSGKVMATGAFAVQLQSYKHEVVNVPNSKVLGTAIRNYGGKAAKHMVLYTEVSIGYDVHWQRVHDLLLEAARKTALLDNQAEPFVLQKKLDDFYVVYELNTFLDQPDKKPRAQSELHANILDVFNAAGIEIMSPHYQAERDGSESTVSNQGVAPHKKPDTP